MRREPGLDVYRALCVVMMFAVHLRRLEPGPLSALGPRGVLDRCFDGLLWSEPVISAAFLFIAGFSLVLSRGKTPSVAAWLARLGRRAGALYLISVALFWAEYGPELPDMWLSSGILAVIATGLVVTGVGLAAPRSLCWLSGVFAITMAASLALDQTDASLSGLNSGPGGALPLMGFAALGAIVALLRERGGSLGWMSAGAVALLVLVALSREPWISLHASLYRDRGADLAMASLFRSTPEGTTRVIFWNHTAAGALGLTAPIVVGLTACLALPRPYLASRVAQPLLLVGRHALAAYVGHLLLLGLLETFGLGPPHAGWTLGGVILLTLLVAVLAAAAERWRARRPSRRPCPPEARSW